MARIRLRLKPREYQIEALKWALAHDGAVLGLPTGSGKTLIAVMWVKELLSKHKVRKVLILEPTRVLVEQVSKYFKDVADLEAIPIYGVIPKKHRVTLWRKAVVAVATPETALNDVSEVRDSGYDAIVIDECHHTTGKDAYAEFIRATRNLFKRRLGLSAYIPPSRVAEIREYIGEIRTWGWNDPRIRPYVPRWIGEVYEAELNSAEEKLLEELERRRNNLTGRERGLVQLAIRWFVRDGALALAESLKKPTKLARLLHGINSFITASVRPAHKLDSLVRVLNDHEGFRKAIIFIERVVIAKYVASKLRSYNSVLVCGKSNIDVNIREVLKRVKSDAVKVIVSTSAGEEGLDLPEADLLVIWSSVASPLRFIQRHGRILRATTVRGPPKFVAYIITPNTVDTDSFVDSIEQARKAGVDVPVSEEVIEELWKRTTRAKILSVLEEQPMPLEWLKKVLELPEDILRASLRKMMEHGDVIYIYTHLGKTYAAVESIDILQREFREYLEADPSLTAKIKVLLDTNTQRTIKGTYDSTSRRLRNILKKGGRIKAILASMEIPLPGGAFKLVNLHYGFSITREDVLDVVLRNIYSARRHYVNFSLR